MNDRPHASARFAMREAPRVGACAILLGLAAASPATGNPWLGRWAVEPTATEPTGETLVYSDAGGGAMRMAAIEDGSVLVTHFDGRPAVIAVPGSRHRHALAIRSVAPTSYVWTMYRDGRPVVRGRNVLAADRRSFTERSWPIANPAKIVTLVYRRR